VKQWILITNTQEKKLILNQDILIYKQEYYDLRRFQFWFN